jgi:hypothetical protein
MVHVVPAEHCCFVASMYFRLNLSSIYRTFQFPLNAGVDAGKQKHCSIDNGIPAKADMATRVANARGTATTRLLASRAKGIVCQTYVSCSDP